MQGRIETRSITIQDGVTGELKRESYLVLNPNPHISAEVRQWKFPQTLPKDPELQQGLARIVEVMRQFHLGEPPPGPKLTPKDSKR